MCSSASGGRKKSTFASIRMARSKEHASSANGLTAKERSRARKDAFHAKKRVEAAAAAVPPTPQVNIVPHATLVSPEDLAAPADDDMRAMGKRGR